MPRVSRQQQHRPNPEHISIEDYFKKTVVIPFLDHLISDISSRFTAHAKQAATIEQLLPTNITSDTTCMSIKELVFWMKSYLAGSVNGYPFHRKIIQIQYPSLLSNAVLSLYQTFLLF